MELEAAASSAVRSDELEHLGRLTEQARIAFGVARDAFLQLETAHQEGRPGTEENAAFRAKVVLFRAAAHAVHQSARQQRGGRMPPTRVPASRDGASSA